MEVDVNKSYEIIGKELFDENYKEITGCYPIETVNQAQITNFQKDFLKTIKNISLNPFLYQSFDKDGMFRKLTFHKYKLMLLYRIDEEKHIIKLLTIFDSRRKITNLIMNLTKRNVNKSDIESVLQSENPDIQTEQLRQTYKELGGDYDEATRQYLAEQARRASMSDVDIIIEDICRR